MTRLINLANFEQFAAINVLTDPGAVGGPTVIPAACQVILNWGLTDLKIGHNVICGGVGAAFTPTVTIANAIMTALSTGSAWTGLAAVLASDSALLSVSLRDLRSADQPIVTSTAAAVAGTAVGLALPNEVALCVTLRTAFAGRGNRGRMFIPGYSVGSVGAANIVSPGTVTATSTWANTIFAALAGQGMTWVLAKRARQAYTGSTGTLHPARAASTVPITAVAVRDNHWDSQRRRGLR